MTQQDIRIGTMVEGSTDPAGYIRQILPYGFESFQIKFWETLGGTDLKRIAGQIKEALAGSGAVVSALGIYGNPLDPSSPKQKETVAAWEKCIDSAKLFGCDMVCGFAGRIIDKPIPDSIPAFKKLFGRLAKRAADKGVRIAFENCDMGGTWWRGDWNIAQTPRAWELIFNAVDSDSIGLEWEPCHQMVKFIDPIPQLRKWVGKIFHLHGKDASIHWDVIREHGVYGPDAYAHHRTPGFGDSNWTDIITILRQGKFTGSIDIEGWHDPVYRGELEMTGQVRALNYLKECRGGQFAPNPK